MRNSTLVVTLLTIALCGAAYWADGSTPGELIVSPTIVGLAVFFHSRTVEGGWLKAGIAAVYLASITLASVSALLIDKALGSAAPANLLQGSSSITGVIFGCAICAIFLKRVPALQKRTH